MENKVEETKVIHNRNIYPSIGQAFALIGVLVLITFVVALVMVILKQWIDPAYNSILNGLMYIITMFCLLIFGIKMRKSLKFNFKWTSFPLLLLAIPLTISFGVLIEPLINLIPMPDSIKEYFNDIIKNDVYAFIMVVIAAPVIEELIFRGIVLEGFLKRYSPLKAIFWSAMIFGIVHLNPWQFFGAFSLGLIIGWVYWKTQSLIPGMVIHFLNNSLAFIMMMATGDNFITTQQLMGDGRSYYVLYGMCVPIFAGSLFLIQQRLKMKDAQM
jgi:membrane protease YdiL (CAAX protease family)